MARPARRSRWSTARGRGAAVMGSGSTVRVVQVTDTHLGAVAHEPVGGADPDERLAGLVRRVGGLDPPADLVLLTGDCSNDGSTDSYRRLHEALADLGTPIVAVAGNHDDPERL